MKDGNGHRRDENREVQPKRADQEQHEQGGFQVGAPPDIAKALGKAASGPDRPGLPMQLAKAQAAQRPKHGDKGRRIDQEYPSGAHHADQHPGHRRADHPRRVERRGIERDGVRQIRVPDQLGDKSLARWRIERRDAAEQERKQIHVPQLDVPREGQEP